MCVPLTVNLTLQRDILRLPSVIGKGVSGLLDCRLDLMAGSINDCTKLTEEYVVLSRIGMNWVQTKMM
jgi:hypothetical protein